MSSNLQVENVNRVVSIPGTQRHTQELFTAAVYSHQGICPRLKIMSAVLNQHAVQDSSFLKSAFFFYTGEELKEQM